MAELFTRAECEAFFREEVRLAGGAKKWLRKNKLANYTHAHHMIDDGRLFNEPNIRAALGFRPVERWEATDTTRS